jgi:hypothetical protein
MEYLKNKKGIILNRELNELDNFVLDFCSLLDNYVIVSGYVSILFGRSRATEDVDLLIPKTDEKEFGKIWKKIHEDGFECVNTRKASEAFRMLDEHAIRFFRDNKPIPNIEFKIIKTDLDRYSFENKIKVFINGKTLFVSPLELQIAYKLFLAADGTDEELIADKDIEDARHLYKLFVEKINKDEFREFISKLKVKKRLRLLE